MLHVYYNRLFFTTNCLLADEGWERKKEENMSDYIWFIIIAVLFFLLGLVLGWVRKAWK